MKRIALILGVFFGSVGANLGIRARYRTVARDLARHAGEGSFTQPVLRRIVSDWKASLRHTRDRNGQALIEHQAIAFMLADMLRPSE